MIQITIDENEPIGLFIRAKANQTGHSVSEVAKEMTQNSFDATVRALHERFMQGEFSQGYMAKQLSISRLDLIHLLEAMGLAVTNV